MISYPEYHFTNLHFNNTELLFCGAQQCPPNHLYGPAVRTHFLMVFIHSGKGIFRARDTLYHLEAGATFFVYPGEITLYQADEKDPWLYSWIGFQEFSAGSDGQQNLTQLLLHSSVTPERPVHVAEDPQPLDQLYRELFGLCESRSRAVHLKAVSLFLDILYQYANAKNHQPEPHQPHPGSYSHMELCLEYIKTYYASPISVSDIAEYVGLSREYFCRLFHRHFGMAPSRFLREYRLKIASVLLVTTDSSISEIASVSGSSHYNYVPSCFSALYGISPLRYRQSARRHDILPDPFQESRQIYPVDF